MNTENSTNPWSAKIDSQEKFDQLLSKHGYPSAAAAPTIRRPTMNGQDSQNPWWLEREMFREISGHYPAPTSVLIALRATGYCGQYFPHISPSDPSMIAFTPDAQSGQADRQVKTTMGRFLRKFLILFSDSYISELEATHRAEMDTTFEVARDINAIEEVYTTMSGDSGCMRYRKGHDHFGHSKYHPSAVYSGEGLGVAYFRNASGDIVARSVIYENPNDPKDKRYVRIYGDAVLRRKLEANGYRCAGLAGARLPMLLDKKSWMREDHSTIVMPYLDPPGGRNSGMEDFSGTYVAWHKGEDFVRVLSRTEAIKYEKAGLRYSGAQSTSGHINVIPVDISSVIFTCGLSGKQFNRLESDVVTVKVLLDDGTVVTASRGAAQDHGHYANSMRRVNEAGEVEAIYVSEANYEKYGFPQNKVLFNDERTLLHYGWVAIDPVIYAEAIAAGLPTHASHTNITRLADDRVVFRGDTVLVYKDGVFNRELCKTSDDAKALKKRGYFSVGTTGGTKRFAHKDDPDVVRTVSGRRALRTYSAVAQRVDGQWDFTRNLHETWVGDFQVFMPTCHDPELKFDGDIVTSLPGCKNLWGRMLGEWNDARVAKHFGSGLSTYGHGFAVLDGTTEPAYVSYRNEVSLDQVVAAANWLVANWADLDKFREVAGANMNWAWVWANLLVTLQAKRAERKEAEYQEALARAEAGALDHNDTGEPGCVKEMVRRAAELTADLEALLSEPMSSPKVRMDTLYATPIRRADNTVYTVAI